MRVRVTVRGRVRVRVRVRLRVRLRVRVRVRGTPMKVEHTMNLSVVVSDRLTQGTRNSQRNSPLSTWRQGYTVSGQCWSQGEGAGEGQGLG